MIIYKATKKEFLEDFRNEVLINKIKEVYTKKVAKPTYSIENSWNNSLPYLRFLLEDESLPEDIGISIEHAIPNIDTKKRIDVLITGKGKNGENVAIVVELKQWSKVEQAADKIGYIVTSKAKEETLRVHPSLQAWSYAYLLERYSSAFAEHNIKTYACVFLHNYDLKENDSLFDDRYKMYLNRACIFQRGQLNELRKYILDKISFGDNCEIIDKIDKSHISICRLVEMGDTNIFKNMENFILVDEQELVYEKAVSLARNCMEDNKKRVLIVKGGPGTGKSILALKFLTDLVINPSYNIENISYITPIQSQRNIYKYKVSKYNLFRQVVKKIRGAGEFVEALKDENDVLIVDEAHRLKEKSGMYESRGENQIKEIINSSKFTVFFIDDLQKVTLKDSGSVDQIKYYAEKQKAEVYEYELTSQFRCSGAFGYVSWIEDVLQLRETANHDGFDTNLNYDIKVVDDPNEMRDYIIKKNKKNNASRIVAGYCWDSKKEARDDPNIYDIAIPKYNFYISWNLKKENWAIAKDSVTRAGCIYTCQGIDFEYIGVIIGKDLVYKDGKVVADHTKRAKTDSALRGLKQMMAQDKPKAKKLEDEIIKNTYRILLTRGLKGCIIFCEDDALRNYLKERIKNINTTLQ